MTHPLVNEYQVAGYDERNDYDSNYHPTAEYNPQFIFAFAGDPEKQAQYQKDLEALGEAEKPKKRAVAKKKVAAKKAAPRSQRSTVEATKKAQAAKKGAPLKKATKKA